MKTILDNRELLKWLINPYKLTEEEAKKGMKDFYLPSLSVLQDFLVRGYSAPTGRRRTEVHFRVNEKNDSHEYAQNSCILLLYYYSAKSWAPYCAKSWTYSNAREKALFYNDYKFLGLKDPK